MPNPIPSAAWPTNLQLNLFHVLPQYLLGLFKRCEFVSWVFELLHINPYNPAWGRAIRRRYASDYLYVRVLFQRTLLVFDPDGIGRVLDRSPSIYGETGLKVRGMNHWQPGAVTVSEGARWQQRRAFNEWVLASGESVHPDGAAFLRAVQNALDVVEPFNWITFSRIHTALAQQVVFGTATPPNEAAFRSLWRLMHQANRLFLLRPNRHLARLLATTRESIAHPHPDGLTARCPHAPQDARTRPEFQAPHWMFAIGNTLAENLIRAVWLIASHPEAEQRVRAEMAGKELGDPAAIDGLCYLEGCIQEVMRLYPTTRLIVRRMKRRDFLGGEVVPAGTQIAIPNSFLHRDRERIDDADRFVPERWLERGAEAPVDVRFNHLSNGPKGCAGRDLVLFLAKGMVAAMLARHHFTVKRPRIDPARPLPVGNNPLRIQFELADNS